MPMRFLLDENVHRKLTVFLTARGHDAKRSPKGLTNGAVFALARAQRRVLITHGDDFAQRPPEAGHRGVVLLRISPERFEQLQRAAQQFILQRYTPKHLENK